MRCLKNKITVAGLLLLLSAFLIYSETLNSTSIKKEIDWLFPRLEGSDNGKRLLELLKSYLDQSGFNYRSLYFNDTASGHSFSQCLEVTLFAENPQTIILCFPLNHPEQTTAEFDYSINLKIALDLLERFKEQASFRYALKILFLGAEYGQPEAYQKYPMGSRLFLENYYPTDAALAFYFNLKRAPHTLVLVPGSRLHVTPNWLLAGLVRKLRPTRLDFSLNANKLQLLRLGMVAEDTIIAPFMQNDYPALAFEGEYGGKAVEQAGWEGEFTGFFHDYLNGIQLIDASNWDLHYLFLNIFGFRFTVPEFVYLGFLLTFTAGIILFLLLNYRSLSKILILVVKRSWKLLLLFAVLCLLLITASGVIYLVLALKHHRTLWTYWPYLFLLLKLVVSITLFLGLKPLLFRLLHSLSRRFIHVSILIVFFICGMALSMVNISLSYYFIWAFLFYAFSLAVPNRIAKTLCLLLSPLWIWLTLIEFCLKPQVGFFQFFLLSVVKGNIFFALFALPFLLFILPLPDRSDKLGKQPRRTKSDLFFWAAGMITAVGIVTLVSVISPFNAQNPQVVQVRSHLFENKPAENYIELNSDAALGNIQYTNDFQTRQISTQSNIYKLPFEYPVKPLGFNLGTENFLDRQDLHVTLDPAGQPYVLRVRLTATESFILYDANYPYFNNDARTAYTLLIGKNPPQPCALDLVVPRNMTFGLHIEVEYLDSPFTLRFSGSHKIFPAKLIRHTEIFLQT